MHLEKYPVIFFYVPPESIDKTGRRSSIDQIMVEGGGYIYHLSNLNLIMLYHRFFRHASDGKGDRLWPPGIGDDIAWSSGEHADRSYKDRAGVLFHQFVIS